jgi:predicted small secreted protein
MKNQNEEYQGWTNSATWCIALYLMQERQIYEKLVKIVKERKVTSEDIKTCWNTMKHEPKDSWTKGKVNWQEIADTEFNNEDYNQVWKGEIK